MAEPATANDTKEPNIVKARRALEEKRKKPNESRILTIKKHEESDPVKVSPPKDSEPIPSLNSYINPEQVKQIVDQKIVEHLQRMYTPQTMEVEEKTEESEEEVQPPKKKQKVQKNENQADGVDEKPTTTKEEVEEGGVYEQTKDFLFQGCSTYIRSILSSCAVPAIILALKYVKDSRASHITPDRGDAVNPVQLPEVTIPKRDDVPAIQNFSNATAMRARD